MGTVNQLLEMTEEGVPPQLTRADDYRVLATTAFALAARHKSMAEKHVAQENKKAAAVYWKLFDEAVGVGRQYLVLAEFAEGKLRPPPANLSVKVNERVVEFLRRSFTCNSVILGNQGLRDFLGCLLSAGHPANKCSVNSKLTRDSTVNPTQRIN